jgi:hypothetical protein
LTLQQVNEDEWDRVLAMNLKSMLLTIRAEIPALESSGQATRS